jgi:hypothetical protein
MGGCAFTTWPARSFFVGYLALLLLLLLLLLLTVMTVMMTQQ